MGCSPVSPQGAFRYYTLLQTVCTYNTSSQVASSFCRYFDLLLAKLEELGTVVSIYSRYEGVFENGSQFQAALSLVYADISSFLEKAKKVFSRRGIVSGFRRKTGTDET